VSRAKKPHSGSRLPAVNLLSPWVFEALATRRLRLRFTAGGVLAVLVITVGWGLQNLRIAQAEQVLRVEQAETGRLTAETQALAPVRAFVATVEQQKVTVQQSMAREIYFSLVLENLRAATPAGADVESAVVTLNPAPPPAPAADPVAPAEDAAATPTAGTAPAAPIVPSLCPGPDPFNTRPVVGCITLSGSAVDRRAVGDLVIRLGDDKLFVEPFISTTTTADGQRVTFTGSVGLSEKVFSNRYADIDQLLLKGTSR
jgi:uncharacterized membrane protein